MVHYNVSSIKDFASGRRPDASPLRGDAIIINHFSKYPLLSFKSADFNHFKQAYNLILKKEHLTEVGFNKLLSLKAAINKGFPLPPSLSREGAQREELNRNYPGIVPAKAVFTSNFSFKVNDSSMTCRV